MERQINFLIFVAIFFGYQVIHLSASHQGSSFNFYSCANDKTIAITGHADETSCRCESDRYIVDPVIREDYNYTPGVGAFKLHTLGKTWNEARKICKEENAHLAIINSLAEEAIFVEMLQKAEKAIKDVTNTEEAFLGIHDMFNEGEWVTIFGDSIYTTGYVNWSSTYWGGQPDNYNSQNCGALIRSGGMDDVHCHGKFAFFCELPLMC